MTEPIEPREDVHPADCGYCIAGEAMEHAYEPVNVQTYDAGEDYGDRFTAVFPDGEMLGIGASGNVPNGFCMHVGNVTDPAYRDGMNLGDPVRFADLPEPVRRAILAELALAAEWQGGRTPFGA